MDWHWRLMSIAPRLVRLLLNGSALRSEARAGKLGCRQGSGARWPLPAARPVREPAVAVCDAAWQGASRSGPAAARGRATGHRAFHRVWGSASRLCPHLLRRLRARLLTRVLVQDALLLPELPSEARAALRRVGRKDRSRAGASPAVRLHSAETLAPDLRAAPAVAR